MEELNNLVNNLFNEDFYKIFNYFEKLDHLLKTHDANQHGFLYLFKCNLPFEIQNNIYLRTYKIGKTEISINARLKNYPLDINIKDIYIMQCDNTTKREQYLKTFISNYTTLNPCMGHEYFNENLEFLRILIYLFSSITISNYNNYTNLFDNIIKTLNIIHNKSLETNTKEFLFDLKLLKTNSSLENYECNFCNKIFSSQSKLNFHQKTAKYCLKIQEEQNEDVKERDNKFSCKYCNKILSQNTNLRIHLNSCVQKKIHDAVETVSKEYEETIETIKETNIKEIEKLKLEYELKLNSQNAVIKELRNQNNSLKKEKYTFL